MSDCDEMTQRILDRIDFCTRTLAAGIHRFATEHTLQMALSRIHGMIDALEDGGDYPEDFFHNTRCSATDAYRAGLQVVRERDAQKASVTA
jgi:hypothetical protein